MKFVNKNTILKKPYYCIMLKHITWESDKDDLIKILNQLIGKAGNQNEW
jgi:hypothetical protein